MSGRRSGNTASSTTPLISTILPTFFSVLDMGLLKGSREDDAPGTQARSQPFESTQAQAAPVAPREVTQKPGSPLRSRQPGDVVEASGVLCDERCQHRP